MLRLLGRETDPYQIRQWCGTTKPGCDADFAIQGLADAGIDAELTQCEALVELAEVLAEGRPPIAVLSEGDGAAHAVVVCGIDAQWVTVMDSRSGTHCRVAHSDFLEAWLSLEGETLLVGGGGV